MNHTKAVAVVKREILPSICALSVPAQKLMALAIGQIRPSSVNLGDLRFVISAVDFAELSGIKPNTAWRQLGSACKHLMARPPILLEKKDILPLIPRVGDSLIPRTPSHTQMHLVSAASYYAYDQEIEIEFSRAFEPYLVQMSKTTIYHKDRVSTIMLMSSKHNLMFYRALAKFGGNKNKFDYFWSVTLDGFREELGLGDSYSDIRNLDKIINPAMLIVEKNSEFKTIKCEKIKVGRKVVSLKFTYENENKPDAVQSEKIVSGCNENEKDWVTEE